ncbi:hypothetical protein BGZ63DRAFT_360201, partial [Mariannaea sp. PMI_226]
FTNWIRLLLSNTQISQNVIVVALLFLHRLDGMNPTIKGRVGSEFRIFLEQLADTTVIPVLDDNTYTNKTWAMVSGFLVEEIHKMEIEFVDSVRYSLFVSREQWEEWLNKLGKYWEYCERAQRSSSTDVV